MIRFVEWVSRRERMSQAERGEIEREPVPKEWKNVHPSMLSWDNKGSISIAAPQWSEIVILDGEEMKMSSQRGGGFTTRGADFNDSMVFMGRSGKMEIPPAEWIKLARKGKIVKREDGKFEMLV
jgi:hypothetical protein